MPVAVISLPPLASIELSLALVKAARTFEPPLAPTDSSFGVWMVIFTR